MNLGAIQLVQPRAAGHSAIAARVGRVSLLYLAVAAIGAVLTLVAFLLTWRNLGLAVIGIVVGLEVIHSATALIDVLTLLIQHMKAEFRALSRIVGDLGAELRTWAGELRRDERAFRPDDTQPIPCPDSTLRRYVLKYASATALFAPALVVLAHVSVVFLWSSLSGLVMGIVVIVLDRLILHIHTVDGRRTNPRRDVTARR